MKISYLIASNRKHNIIKQTIDNIYNLDKHDFEVIVCSTIGYQDNRAICLLDHQNKSTFAFNEAYKNSTGDLIVVCVDDHLIPQNIVELPKFFMQDRIKNLKLKIANLTYALGGPGKFYYDKPEKFKHDDLGWEIKALPEPLRSVKNMRPFNIYHFPAILKESIEEYMDGVIFNDSFMHHYVDSWLGFYEEKINGIREPEDIGPHDIWFEVIPSINNSSSNSRYDNYDCQILTKLIYASDTDISYNTKVEL